MNVNEVIKRLRVMLSVQKFAEATLVDGTEVYTEGALEVGAILFVRAGDGVSDDPFAPAGKHELTDGTIVTVGENGEISQVDAVAPDAPADVAMEDVVVPVDVAPEAVTATEDLLAGIAEILIPFTEEIATLNDQVTALSKRFEKMAAEPAAPRVSNTFSEIKTSQKTLSSERLSKLAQMRK